MDHLCKGRWIIIKLWLDVKKKNNIENDSKGCLSIKCLKKNISQSSSILYKGLDDTINS